MRFTIKKLQMNKNRRKDIEQIIDKLGALKQDIEFNQNAEEEYFNNMPESLQGGEKGQKSEESSSSMQSALDSLEEAIEYLQSSIE